MAHLCGKISSAAVKQADQPSDSADFEVVEKTGKSLFGFFNLPAATAVETDDIVDESLYNLPVGDDGDRFLLEPIAEIIKIAGPDDQVFFIDKHCLQMRHAGFVEP